MVKSDEASSRVRLCPGPVKADTSCMRSSFPPPPLVMYILSFDCFLCPSPREHLLSQWTSHVLMCLIICEQQLYPQGSQRATLIGLSAVIHFWVAKSSKKSPSSHTILKLTKDFFESLSIDLHEDGEAYLFFYVSKGDILYQLTCKGKTTDLTSESPIQSCDTCQRVLILTAVNSSSYEWLN